MLLSFGVARASAADVLVSYLINNILCLFLVIILILAELAFLEVSVRKYCVYEVIGERK